LNYTKGLIRTPLSLDIGTEVQQQTLTLTLVDVNMERLVETKLSMPIEIIHEYNLLESLDLQKIDLNLSSNDIYSTLKELYNSQIPNPVYMPYVKNTLITNGRNVAVTKDLTNIVQTRAGNTANPIFSKYTLEGSHFLVQACTLSLKIILISPKHASIILKDMKNYDFNNDKFWICDLSGAITATNGNSDEKGENIMNFIPQSKMMIFDLLVFNGSFDQIIKSVFLKDIYKRIWISSDHFKERAIFLRIRMKILMEKDAEIFEDDDSEIGMLRNYSLGVSDPSFSEVTIDGYPKPPVNSEYETKVKLRLRLGLKSHTSEREQVRETVHFDLNREIELLFGFEFQGDESKPLDIKLGLQPNSIFGNVDLDLSETITRSHVERELIHFPEIPKEKEISEIESIGISSNDIVTETDDDPITSYDIDIDNDMPDFEEAVINDVQQKYIIDKDFEELI